MAGWYYGNFLWKLRGWLDLLVGGVGLCRGRRDPVDLQIGDAVDFWRVEAIEPGPNLRLVAEMRLPGRAWLEFEVTADCHGFHDPSDGHLRSRGLGGLAYWYALYPMHWLVFAGVLRGLMHAAEERAHTDRR